jgi:hypothetical protein
MVRPNAEQHWRALRHPPCIRTFFVRQSDIGEPPNSFQDVALKRAEIGRIMTLNARLASLFPFAAILPKAIVGRCVRLAALKACLKITPIILTMLWA